MFRFDFQKLWVVYLIASSTVFTIPEPVFAQSPVFARNSTNPAEPTGGGGGTSLEGDVGGAEGGAEPIVSGSSPISENVVGDEENIVAEASNNNNNKFRGGPMAPRKQNQNGGRPPRRHPPPRKISPIPPPPQRPLMLKPGTLNKPKPVPKYKHKEHLRDSRERHRPPPPPPSRGQSNEESSEVSSKYRNPPDVITSASKEEYFPSGQSGEYSKEKSRPGPPPPPPPPHSLRDSKPGHGPTPASSTLSEDSPAWPKQPRPVMLSYYYDSQDGQDLKHLVKDHHLRRRKDCDGLDNFVYDLDVIAFLLGVIAAGIGLYSDVIPFFNEGVKITYNNDLMGDGVDFPHDYWPKYDAQIDAARSSAAAGAGALNQIVLGSAIPSQQTTPVGGVHQQQTPQRLFKRRAGSGRTISIGSKEDNIREVMSVTGEFIGLLGLGISFIALFPHLVEKFFYSLDWWFGKRGLWKQYLYTYKCEIHPYPQPGWGRR